MKLRKGKTKGNVTQLKFVPGPLDYLSYDELLAERRFMENTGDQVIQTRKTLMKVDPRGMWCESIGVILKELDGMDAACRRYCELAEKRMINLTRNGK